LFLSWAGAHTYTCTRAAGQLGCPRSPRSLLRPGYAGTPSFRYGGDMTAAPTWTILVPTLGERRPLFERLMAGLLPQLHPYEGRVRVVGWFNNGKPSLPEIRQRMVLDTETDYLSFADDDDLVSPFYVAEVVKALEAGPDYVGFQVQCYSDDHPTALAYHSLVNGRWRNTRGRYYRDISHINPMLTEIARTADFRRTRRGMPEDRAWVDQLRRGGLLRTEVVVDRVLYHYLYSTSREHGLGSRWQSHHKIHPSAQRSVIANPYFTWSSDVRA
jgi:hypothetical protein